VWQGRGSFATKLFSQAKQELPGRWV